MIESLVRLELENQFLCKEIPFALLSCTLDLQQCSIDEPFLTDPQFATHKVGEVGEEEEPLEEEE